jgi:nucleotide-binding universal stress UspA family protein
MFKDIVIPITGTSGDSYALNIALDLASAHGAHLTVMEIVNLPLPVTGPWGLMPDISLNDVYQELREKGQANVVALRTRLEKETVSTEVRLVESLLSAPHQLVTHYAHYADLAVISGAMGDSAEGDLSRTYFGSLLIDSGRPVLVVPPRCKAPMPARKIVAAWRPTRECARAFHDALPLLAAAESVELLVVDPVGGERGHGEQPGADIAAHLSRHGVKVNVQVRQSHDNRIASVLLDHVKETHAHMLVVGGYGHSRIREWAFGGVTRELLFEANIPVFYSH